ncbi:hypothetical protein GINT2_001471 [Glugoides intestinalis]
MIEKMSDKASFRSIFLHYQIVKCIEVVGRTKIFSGFDIKTKSDVIIRFKELVKDNEKLENSTLMDKRAYNCLEKFKIMQIFNLKTFPRIFLNTRIQNYQVTIHSVEQGRSLQELGGYEILRVFRELIKILNQLFTFRVRVSELSIRNICISKDNTVKITEVDWMHFDDGLDDLYENMQARRLIKSFITLFENCKPKSKDECVLNEKFNKKIEDLKLILKSNIEKLKFSQFIESNIETLSFKPITIVDPLIIMKIEKLGVASFSSLMVNDKSRKEFYIYRLIDENIVRCDLRNYSKEIYQAQNRLKKLSMGKCEVFIEKEENDLLELLFRKEKEQTCIIKNRITAIHRKLKYYSPLYRCINCMRTDQVTYFEVQVFQYEELLKAIERIKNTTMSIWKVKEIIHIKDESIELHLVASLKKSHPMTFILFTKKSGSDGDFIRLISEIIEAFR